MSCSGFEVNTRHLSFDQALYDLTSFDLIRLQNTLNCQTMLTHLHNILMIYLNSVAMKNNPRLRQQHTGYLLATINYFSSFLRVRCAAWMLSIHLYIIQERYFLKDSYSVLQCIQTITGLLSYSPAAQAYAKEMQLGDKLKLHMHAHNDSPYCK